MQSLLEKELIGIGLSEKAVKVYLASLELGPAPVQGIAKKALVNRPTAYVMIEALTEKGLMSSFEKGKKRFFKAEDPENLLSLVIEEKRNAEAKEISIKKILPELKKYRSFFADKPGVSFYEGPEGTAALREDVIRSGAKELFEFVPIDVVRQHISEEAGPDDLRHEIRKNLKIKSVYTTSRGPIYKEIQGNSESRYLPNESLDLQCEIIVYGDKTALFSFSGKPTGVSIHDKKIAESMKSLFKLAWREAERQKKK